MPAQLVPREAIPKLAEQVRSPDLYLVLQYLQKAGYLRGNGDENLVGLANKLAALELVDVAYADPSVQTPYLWTINGNGSRVLKHMETSEASQDAVKLKFKINPRAHTALLSLPDEDQLKVLLSLDAFAADGPASWSNCETVAAGGMGRVYALPISPDLRAFVRISPSGEIELFDLVQEETLRLFLQQQGAGVRVG